MQLCLTHELKSLNLLQTHAVLFSPLKLVINIGDFLHEHQDVVTLNYFVTRHQTWIVTEYIV